MAFHTRFRGDISGNIAMIFSLALFPMIGLAGASMDYSRASAAKISMQSALDAGILAAGRAGMKEEEEITAFLEAYVGPHVDDLSLASWEIGEVIYDKGTVTAHASADFETSFVTLFGLRTIDIVANARAVRSMSFLELAMVLDNTGSMATNNRIGSLRDAASTLVDTLYETDEAADKVKISLVPYVTAVNILADGFDWSWIDTQGCAEYHGANFWSAQQTIEAFGGVGGTSAETDCHASPSPVFAEDATDASNVAPDFVGPGRRDQRRAVTSAEWDGLVAAVQNKNGAHVASKVGSARNHLEIYERLGLQWKGCVEARPAPYDTTDTMPSAAAGSEDTLFVPYLWPDTPDTGVDQGQYKNNFTNDTISTYFPDLPPADLQSIPAKYFVPNNPVSGIDEVPPATKGPNKSCGQALVPLTNDKDRLLAEIGAMKPWDDSGTNAAEGIAWGWRTLSPQAPFTDGRAYDANLTVKALVVLTDGENQIHGGWSSHNKSDYSSYGFLAEERLGTSARAASVSAVDQKMSTVCTNAKQAGIRVYTITFQVSNSNTKQRFKNCASAPELYFNSPSTSELAGVFRKIALDLSNLHLAM